MQVCKHPNCGRPHASKGYCSMHWQRLRRTGSPDGVKTAKGSARAFFEEALRAQNKDECLIWPFSVGTRGYPKVTIDGVRYNGHHRVCELAHGPRPTPAHETAHWCGIRKCINPHHLRWATSKENSQDSLRMGRTIRGSDHPCSRLKVDQVRQIRQLGRIYTNKELGDLYGVSPVTISRIVRRQAWAWLDAEKVAA